GVAIEEAHQVVSKLDAEQMHGGVICAAVLGHGGYAIYGESGGEPAERSGRELAETDPVIFVPHKVDGGIEVGFCRDGDIVLVNLALDVRLSVFDAADVQCVVADFYCATGRLNFGPGRIELRIGKGFLER